MASYGCKYVPYKPNVLWNWVSIQYLGPTFEWKLFFGTDLSEFKSMVAYPVYISSSQCYLWQYLVTWGDENIQVAGLFGFICHHDQSDAKEKQNKGLFWLWGKLFIPWVLEGCFWHCLVTWGDNKPKKGPWLRKMSMWHWHVGEDHQPSA